MSVNKQSLAAAIQNENFSAPFVRFLNDLISDRNINTGPAQPRTIASGSISAISGYSYYAIDTEGASASDDLTTIGNLNEGDLVFFKAANSARTVVFKDGAGNILTNGSVDLSLDNTEDLIIGHYDGTNLKCALWDIGT